MLASMYTALYPVISFNEPDEEFVLLLYWWRVTELLATDGKIVSRFFPVLNLIGEGVVCSGYDIYHSELPLF